MGYDKWVTGRINSRSGIQFTKAHFGQLIAHVKMTVGDADDDDSSPLLKNIQWLLGHTSFLHIHFT